MDQLKDCDAGGSDETCGKADMYCMENVQAVLDSASGRDELDIRELQLDPFPPGQQNQSEAFIKYLNTEAIQSAIGAFVNFTNSPAVVRNAFKSTGGNAKRDDTIAYLTKLLKRGVKILLFFRDADYSTNWLGGEAVSEEVGACGFSKAGYADIKTSDGKTRGQVKQSGGFSFARIYNAGREVPW